MLDKNGYWELEFFMVLGMRQMKIKTAVLRDMMPGSLLDKYQRFGDTCFLNLPWCGSTFIRILVGIHGTTRHHTPEDSLGYSRQRGTENSR
jgi:hypothetical protein